MSKIVISGCSYSTGYQHHLKTEFNMDVDRLAIPGQSNESIIRKIYDYIINENCKNVLFKIPTT